MGGEFGQWREWNFDESLEWHLCQFDSHKGLAKSVADLNHLVRRERALHELDFEGRGFEWVDCHNWQDSVLVFIRRAADPADFLVVCCNFTPVPRENYRVGVPQAGIYDEIFNSDSPGMAGATSATPAACSPSTSRTTAASTASRSPCRRWPPSSSSPACNAWDGLQPVMAQGARAGVRAGGTMLHRRG